MWSPATSGPVDEADVALSTQVLQEFYVQATHSRRPDRLPHEQAATLIDSFLRFPVQATTTKLVLAALETRERYQISYWDAAIIEAARAAGCPQVLSEDLAHGQDYGGVRVENPFRERSAACRYSVTTGLGVPSAR